LTATCAIPSPFRSFSGSGSELLPIYDGHGNNVGLVSRDPQIPGGFVVTNRRAYDAWGLVRQGAAAAEPWQRYCGNLGHVQDDKSGLIYMRARYYEPWSGRFVSEDPARDGLNWYSYCKNDPVNSSDASGKFAITLGLALAGFIIGFLTGGITALLGGPRWTRCL
jgi:RHS repeat-associated protein